MRQLGADRQIPTWGSGSIARFWRARSGGVMIYMGLTIAVLLGVSGLAVDVSIWHAESRTTQSIADAAAMAGTNEIRRQYASADVAAVAETDAVENGFRTAASYPSSFDTMTINNVPTSGDFTTDADAVEVTVSRSVDVLLSSVIFTEPVTVTTRAVATLVIGGSGCVIALNPTASKAIDMAGTSDVELDCGVESNSTAADAVAVRGAACLETTSVISAGGTSFNGCVTSTSTQTNATTSGDPLELQQPPAIPGTCHPDGLVHITTGPTTLTPAYNYCNGILIEAGATVDFDPGTYVISDGGITFKSSTITGDEVSFYFPPGGSATNNIDIEAGAAVTMSAPDETGELPGILFYTDRAATGVTHSIAGQAATSLDGIFYLPNDDITFAGGSGTMAVMIIADTVTFTGTSDITSAPTSAAYENKLLSQAKLVE